MKDLIIIAEAGVNHNGSLKKALRLVDVAAKAKADFVKFQTYKTENLVRKNTKKSSYQIKNTKFKNQFKMLKEYELNENQFKKIVERCRIKKIKFLSSPFDIQSLNLLKKLKCTTIKIPSGEITNIPLLEEIGKSKRKVILSTGMSNFYEILKAIKILTSCGTKKQNISLLHCNTEYPVNFKNTNLKAIIYLKKKFKLNVGFSDHTTGFEAALVSIGLGAQIIEKHFTTSKSLHGPDHKASLDEKELINFVSTLREAQKSLGQKIKMPSSKELQNAKFIRKNIVAKKEILIGDRFTKDNITTKRSNPGISSANWKKVINKVSKFNFLKDQNIKI